jgi:N-acetylglutamate synthase-like GNAT family acetyltransferase
MIPSVRQAIQDDLEQLQSILETSGLSAHGILEPNTTCWLAEINNHAMGCIALQWGASAALLCSAAVLPDHRGHGLGSRLLETALNGARAEHKRSVYLFSTDAGEYWTRQGFKEVPVPELVKALPDAPQVHHYRNIGWLPTEIAWRLEVR